MCKRNQKLFEKGKKIQTHLIESPKAANSEVAGMAMDRSSHTKDFYMFSVYAQVCCK